MKSLICSWSVTPQSKAMLNDMLTNDKKQYKQCRINSAPDEVGVADLRSRKKAVLESTQPMIQVFGVRDASDLLWLTRERCIAHHIYVEAIAGAMMRGKEEATAEKWTRGLANRDMVRRGTGVDLFLTSDMH